jgi:hypothetical protein
MHASRKLIGCLLLCLFTALAGCESVAPTKAPTEVPTKEPTSGNSYSRDSVTFNLPANWKPVPGRKGTLFAPEGISYEKSQIEIRVTRNHRVGARKVRQGWKIRRESAERSSQLIAVNTLTVNGFEAFEVIRRAPAPSPELIPIEYQVAGDQIFYQVEIIGNEHRVVSVHLLVEEAYYDQFLEVFRDMLNTIRMGRAVDGNDSSAKPRVLIPASATLYKEVVAI